MSAGVTLSLRLIESTMATVTLSLRPLHVPPLGEPLRVSGTPAGARRQGGRLSDANDEARANIHVNLIAGAEKVRHRSFRYRVPPPCTRLDRD